MEFNCSLNESKDLVTRKDFVASTNLVEVKNLVGVKDLIKDLNKIKYDVKTHDQVTCNT